MNLNRRDDVERLLEQSSSLPAATWICPHDGVFNRIRITNALNTLLAAIPALIGALLILLIGWILSGIVARVRREEISVDGAGGVRARSTVTTTRTPDA